jgi:hypothetical protein
MNTTVLKVIALRITLLIKASELAGGEENGVRETRGERKKGGGSSVQRGKLRGLSRKNAVARWAAGSRLRLPR